MKAKNKILITTFLFIFVSVLTFLSMKFPTQSKAASLKNFKAGNIISDYMMSNYTSMSEEEIQNFLTSKNSCNNTDYNLYESLSSRYPNIKWHFENGHFICLSEELFGDGETIGEGETAAHIIWQTAQDYQINPQVLIVLLQKESSLITDAYPNSINYRSATGYGCPDTAACSEKYYGFKNQVRNAAKLFRTVLDGGWTNYPLGENYIKYNPDSSCGGSIVNIENLATSALYRYTPYQPNAGAIAAGYGTAPCGAYGNRNFYLYFSDWFGDPTANISFVSLQTPRYFELKNDANRINPFTNEQYDVLEKGRQIKFTSKILINNNWCFRTEHNTDNRINACIFQNNLKEIELEYEDIEQYAKIKDGASKYLIRSELNVMDISNAIVRKIVKKTIFRETTYYVTVFDNIYNESEYGIKEADLEFLDIDENAYLNIKPIYLRLTKNVDRINPFTNEYYDTLEKGRTIKFTSKIQINDDWYYRTENNTINNINAVIPASATEEI